VAIVLLAVAASAAVVVSDLPPLLRALAVLAAGIYAAYEVLRLLRPAVEGLRLDGERMVLRWRGGESTEGLLVGRPFVSGLYIAMVWRPARGGRARRIGLFRDQMAPADFRRLAAALRTAARH
jgi:hypothetical protein